MWNMKIMVIPIVNGMLRMVAKDMERGLEEL